MHKKIRSFYFCCSGTILVFLTILMLAVCINARAEITSDGIVWQVDNTGKLTIYHGEDTPERLSCGWGDNDDWKAYKGLVNCIAIQSGFTSIDDFAFCNFSEVVTVSIPSSVKKIGMDAFANCSKLKSVTLTYVTEIEDLAFRDCDSLETISFSSIVSIGSSAFSNCDSLTRVEFTSTTLRKLGSSAFGWCLDLEIHLPPDISEIGSGAFSEMYRYYRGGSSTPVYGTENGRNSATKVYADKDSVTARSLGTANCGFIDPDYPNATLQYITDEEDSFTPVKLAVLRFHDDATEIVIPDGTWKLIENSLHKPDNDERRKIWLPASLEKAEDFSFDYSVASSKLLDIYIDLNAPAATDITDEFLVICDSVHYPKLYLSKLPFETEWSVSRCDSDITDPVFPPNLNSVYMENCTELTSLVIPDGVISMGVENCSKLASISIPASVERFYIWSFTDCPALKTISVASGNTAFTTKNNVLLSKDKSTLVLYPAGKTNSSYTIPDSVTTIESRAFNGCSHLNNLTIPATVTEMSDIAFWDCPNLTLVIAPTLYLIEYCEENNKQYTIPGLNNGYPESPHPYTADYSNTWTYTHPDNTDYLRIRFFDATMTAGENDRIVITDSMGNEETYSGTELAGAEIFLPGKSFTIAMSTDSYGNHYGFSISSITGITAAEYAELTNQPRFFMSFGTIMQYINPQEADTLVIPQTVEGQTVTAIGDRAFMNHSELVSVTLPETVTSIGKYAFAMCDGLKTANIPDGITVIEVNAFYECEMLTGITLPSHLTNLGWYAFAYCDHLTGTITIPAGLKELGDSAFAATRVTGFTVTEGNTAYEAADGVLFSSGKKAVIAYPAGKEGASYTIPDGVTGIGEGAFAGCRNLISLTVPDSVSRIDSHAFYSCPNLVLKVIPGSYAHDYCTTYGLSYEFAGSGQDTSLESEHPYANDYSHTWTYVHPAATDYLKIVFSDETETEDNYDWIYITDSTGNTESYTGTALGGAVIYLPGNSFYIRLTSDSSINKYGFAVVEVTGLTAAEYEALNGSILYSGRWGDLNWKLNDAGVLTISGSGEIEGIDSTEGVVDDTCAWRPYKTEISKVVIQAGVTGIGDYAFNQISLTSVSIPDSVEYIGSYAFGDTGLPSVTIPDSMCWIGPFAFSNSCLTSVTIPDSVYWIGYAAFYHSEDLVSVTLPDGITEIDGWMFGSCSSLSSINIPDSVTSIGEYAFFATDLTNLTLPDGLTSIGENAFDACKKLTGLSIPGSVSQIGKEAFQNCGKLALALYPTAYLLDYAKTNGIPYLVRADRMLTVPAGTTHIETEAFQGSGCEVVIIPYSIQSIGPRAFAGCTNLIYISLPSGFTNIDETAFEGSGDIYIDYR